MTYVPEPEGAAASAARRKELVIAAITVVAIAVHLVLRFAVRPEGAVAGVAIRDLPLIVALVAGGAPLVLDLAVKLVRREFGSDLLAGISIVTAVLLHEYLAGALVVLMLSGGAALEAYAVRSASSVLAALARRMPSAAHRKRDGTMKDVSLDDVEVGDVLVVLPHEICPVDGVVLDGHSVMDESYLTGEPYMMSKTPGSEVLSGAINGEAVLTIRAVRLAVDSRYAKIMEVMRASEQSRPKLRRLADQLGAYYTPLAIAIALAAWFVSGESVRFLAVLVVATPCPLLIAIPVALVGSISLSARRGIIIKDPVVLERIDNCRTAIFDKTGTLTYGRPSLTEIAAQPGFDETEVLRLVASLERYSKHPLAGAVVDAAEAAQLPLVEAVRIAERPGRGIEGTIDGKKVEVTNRKELMTRCPGMAAQLPTAAVGLESVVLIDGELAATLTFRDEVRSEGESFIRHLRPQHELERVLLVSGDRESEVRYLAEKVGIEEVFAGRSPEQKLAIVREETKRTNTVFLGDGINDAPAMTAATVGIAFGSHSDITAEAAGAVIMDSSLHKVDEFFHISRRMRTIALQSAIGGMALSVIGMGFAAAGYLPPVAGAIAQEIVDLLAVLNALRVALPPRTLTDYHAIPLRAVSR